MRVIFILLMLSGVLITIQPPFSRARVVALWSDFKQFEANAAQFEGGRAVLALGGENPNESFEDLLKKLLDLKSSTAVSSFGIIVFVLSAFGFIMELRRARVEPATAGNSRPAGQASGL